MADTLPTHSVTGLVLAGGQGSRMGGLDKGLQAYAGQALAQRALERLRQQQGDLLAGCMLSANRNLETYAGWNLPVLSDALPGHAGPLAGVLSGLAHCPTPWLLCVPCDCPRFPLDLLPRLAQELTVSGADLALAVGRDDDGCWRDQPVFCLLRQSLHDDLARYLAEGGRAMGRWLDRQACVRVRFDATHDDPLAFANANTLAELQALQSLDD
ncbi:MAG TPA: molybdenum cofactor guanylyltransferase MobA [Macromonas sp.]|nr:molybdenum cofactor guanylyltransferase MobA [Macromonas sp.]